MKKIGISVVLLLIIGSVFLLGFGYKTIKEPNTFYQVYMDKEIIGVIKSKSELEKYIDKEGEYIKRKYNVKNVYAPEGIEIKKIVTYDSKIDSVKKVYQKIKKIKSFTILGYQVTIRQETVSFEDKNKKEVKVNKYYVLDEKVFKNSLEATIKIFVGKDKYENYKNNDQTEIETTGSKVTDIYVEGNKTIKKMKIPVSNKIYIDEKELTHDLVFGENSVTKKYIVQVGDTIEKVAFNNQISVEEFLISNPDFTNAKNLLFPNQEVTIGVTNPQLNVVMNEYVVEDKESNFTRKIVYDSSMQVGDEYIAQRGEKGLERISQTVKTVNGVVNYVDPLGKEVLKAPVEQIVSRGTQKVTSIGSGNWAWPSESGYTITSYYSYRINPITRRRELHDAIDIAGTGYGSNVYAANNGTVVVSSYTYVNGNYIVINHNNGYYTYYGHMSKLIARAGQVVEKGQVIGKVGKTGFATGPHIHFGIWSGMPYSGGRSYNPLNFY